jgi:hypothetical protein
MFGIFLGVPVLRATESSGVDARSNTIGEALSVGAPVGWPFNTVGNLSLGAVGPSEAQAESAEADKLAKQLANPISSLISVPFQANEDWGYGPSGNGHKFTLNIQPVIPISISKNWNVIVRTILPIVSQHDLFYVPNLPKDSPLQPQNRSQDGLSDTTQSFFFSPKKPGPFGLIWGIGPAFLYPTGTHPLLDTGTFSIGPTVVVLEQQGPWTLGCLMNQLWSVVISEHRSSVSQMFIQPFIAYTTKTHTTFTIIRNPRQIGTLPPATGNGRSQSFSKSVRFLRLGNNRSVSRLVVNTMPIRRATGRIGVCDSILLCFTQQAGIPSLLREPA